MGFWEYSCILNPNICSQFIYLGEEGFVPPKKKQNVACLEGEKEAGEGRKRRKEKSQIQFWIWNYLGESLGGNVDIFYFSVI